METYRVRGGTIKVILDTNMLLVPYQFKIDIFEEIQRLLPGAKVYTIPQVKKELKSLLSKGVHERLGAKLALKLLENVPVIPFNVNTPTDRALLELAKKGYIIATNDRELRRRIREIGGTTIFLRERTHLEMD